MFRKKEKAETVGSNGVSEEEITPESRIDEDRDQPDFFGNAKEEEIGLIDVVAKVIHKLRTLDKERSKVVEEIERLGGEAEKEFEVMMKELSALREQAVSLREVLEQMHRKRRI